MEVGRDKLGFWSQGWARRGLEAESPSTKGLGDRSQVGPSVKP